MHPLQSSLVTIFGCAFSYAAQAQAGELACAPLESIKEVKAFECNDNHFYGQAGLDCLHWLENTIQARAGLASKQMAASNVKKVDEAGNAQTHNFQGSTGDYSLSQEALAELIRHATNAKNTVDVYLHNVYYPEDWDAPESLIGDTNKFLDANPCYADNRDGLREVKKRIETYITQLQAAKAASLARANIATDRDQNQGSINAQIVNGSGQGTGKASVAVPAGRSRNPASSITGVEQDAQKRAKDSVTR